MSACQCRSQNDNWGGHIFIYSCSHTIISNMAVSCVISSSLNHTNFILENVDLEPIRLLNNQAYLTYDGTRIKWAQDFSSLQNFVKNVAGLSGEWESPGGRAKRFNDSNLDFVMTWYPGKLNSLIFHGKEGESFKKFLVRI